MPLTPFGHPLFVAWKSLPLLLRNPPFTYLETPPLCGANSRPLWSQVGCILTPPTPPFPFPLPMVPLA